MLSDLECVPAPSLCGVFVWKKSIWHWLDCWLTFSSWIRSLSQCGVSWGYFWERKHLNLSELTIDTDIAVKRTFHHCRMNCCQKPFRTFGSNFSLTEPSNHSTIESKLGWSESWKFISFLLCSILATNTQFPNPTQPVEARKESSQNCEMKNFQSMSASKREAKKNFSSGTELFTLISSRKSNTWKKFPLFSSPIEFIRFRIESKVLSLLLSLDFCTNLKLSFAVERYSVLKFEVFFIVRLSPPSLLGILVWAQVKKCNLKSCAEKIEFRLRGNSLAAVKHILSSFPGDDWWQTMTCLNTLRNSSDWTFPFEVYCSVLCAI